MAKIKKLSEIKQNQQNPRKIDKIALEKLKKSIQEFPEMLELRPIVVNKDGVVLGGNMRLRAMKELGIKECPVEVADKLTPEQEREFVIKDNVSGGDWDWDIIDTEWADLPLEDWGLKEPELEIPDIDMLGTGETLSGANYGDKCSKGTVPFTVLGVGGLIPRGIAEDLAKVFIDNGAQPGEDNGEIITAWIISKL